VYSDDYKRVRQSETRDRRDAGSNDYEYNDEDEDFDEYGEDGFWWPTKAKHQPRDFTEFFNCPTSSMLCYTFAGEASQGLVPDSEEPPFR
jgi:hypothetical protein